MPSIDQSCSRPNWSQFNSTTCLNLKQSRSVFVELRNKLSFALAKKLTDSIQQQQLPLSSVSDAPSSRPPSFASLSSIRLPSILYAYWTRTEDRLPSSFFSKYFVAQSQLPLQVLFMYLFDNRSIGIVHTQ